MAATDIAVERTLSGGAIVAAREALHCAQEARREAFAKYGEASQRLYQLRLPPRSPVRVASDDDARAAALGVIEAERVQAEHLRATETEVHLLKQRLDEREAEERQCVAALQGLLEKRVRLRGELPTLRRYAEHASRLATDAEREAAAAGEYARRRRREADEEHARLARAEATLAALQGEAPEQEDV